MKFISWNVNGLRACVQKGFLEYFNSTDADFFLYTGIQITGRANRSRSPPAIISIGITPRKKDIPALLFLPDTNQFPSHMD